MRLNILLIILLSHAATAQFNYALDPSIPVSLSDQQLTAPWAGGLNASQFNTMDLNHDDKDDLVIYDRMTGRVITFLQENNKHQYAPEYGNSFPQEIASWMLLRDYNGDGKKDIFTGDNLGMKVYENITTIDGLPEWKQVLFFSGFAGPKSSVLLTKGVTFKINLQLNYDDLPSISDADGDGDLDIFNAGYTNSSQIEYHKNLSIEKYGTLDSLDFERITQSWGGVRDCNCGEFSFSNVPCDGGGRISHTGGKSLLSLDVDNDGDTDLLFSESECTNLFLLRNNGTNENPIVTTGTSFPSTQPVFFFIYPSAYYEDVDFDGVKDLIVSPNIFSRDFLQTDLRQSTWFYKNTGTTGQPVFSNLNKDFLQEDMIDVGENAAPAFFDRDGDGDLDLFVGTYANNFSGSIFYFENTGAQSSPHFKLITTDFLGLSYSNLINIRPMFADMNGDSKWDLVFTATNRFSGTTELYYFLNQQFIGTYFINERIESGFLVFPNEPLTLADVDLDQKIDILVGKQNGTVAYWKNTGTFTKPSWTIEDESFLGLGPNYTSQYLACHTTDLDGDSKADLILGDQQGNLALISNYREASDVTERITGIIYNPLLESYQSQNLGGRVWPTTANIFRANKPTIVVGNAHGGLHILKNAESTPLPKSPIIDIYPNPLITDETSTMNIMVDRPAIMESISLTGQEVTTPKYFQALQEYKIQFPAHYKGVYLLRFWIDGKSVTRKILVI